LRWFLASSVGSGVAVRGATDGVPNAKHPRGNRFCGSANTPGEIVYPKKKGELRPICNDKPICTDETTPFRRCQQTTSDERRPVTRDGLAPPENTNHERCSGPRGTGPMAHYHSLPPQSPRIAHSLPTHYLYYSHYPSFLSITPHHPSLPITTAPPRQPPVNVHQIFRQVFRLQLVQLHRLLIHCHLCRCNAGLRLIGRTTFILRNPKACVSKAPNFHIAQQINTQVFSQLAVGEQLVKEESV